MEESQPMNVEDPDVDNPQDEDDVEIVDAPAADALPSSRRYRSPIWDHFKKSDNLKAAI